MGQYHIAVNLDKREFIHPHQLGDGLKLWEQAANGPGGVGSALIVLTAVSNGRGGGDFRANDPDGIIGRWGGDRIAIVGDYAEPNDLPGEFYAEHIYGNAQSAEYGDEPYRPDLPVYTDITAKVIPILAEELRIAYEGSGWRTRVER